MLLSILAFSLALVHGSGCGDYQSCSDCLHPAPGLDCGWCSPKPAQWAGGGDATKCMDHTSKGWDCFHLYMHDGCVAGYVCNNTIGKCMLGKAGEGDTKENCEKSCFPPGPPPPPKYSCNTTSFTCQVETSGGSEKGECDDTCTNSTPSDLIGLWRGLQVSSGFEVGEWEMNITQSKATWGPHATPTKFEAAVASLSRHLIRLTMTNGTVLYASFATPGWPTGPETHSVAIAIQKIDTRQVPPQPEEAMAHEKDFDVFVFHACNDWKKECNFGPAFAASARRQLEQLGAAAPLAHDRWGLPTFLSREFAAKLAPVTKLGADDPCGVHADCGSCINDPLKVCGWCDGIITFGDGTTCGENGEGCCGGASGFSKCNVAYRKECPVMCDFANWTNPSCRYCTAAENKDPDVQKFKDCDEVASWCKPPAFGHYCDKNASQCISVDTKEECEKNPECDPENPKCADDCVAKTYMYCDPDAASGGGSGGCQGPVNETECKNNPKCDIANPTCNPTICTAPTYYTCDNAPDFQCHEHTGKLPGGRTFNTSKECEEACYDSDVAGVWRGLRIDNGFVVDEWDFSFEGTATPPKVTYSHKASGTTLTGTYAIGAALEADDFDSFELTITLSTGEVLKGLYNNKDNGPVTRFMYLGLPLKDGETTTSYTDAMAAAKQEFVLIACKPSIKGCDFTPAKP